MTPGRLERAVRAAVGDDATGGMWDRLTPEGRAVLRFAFVEARELGHPCLADEHVLLGVLRHGAGRGADLLRERGVTLAAARAELLRVGPTMSREMNPAVALQAVGIDVDAVRQRLEGTFGADAVHAAERRVRRRPRWRGGHPRPSALCMHLAAKRAFHFAALHARHGGDDRIGPDQLLYGVLQDARDPLGTELSRRSRRGLAQLGFITGRANPVRIQLEARGIDLTGLATELAATG